MQANRGVTLICLSLITMQVLARQGSPKDVLTLQPNWPLFFTGETVTFRCSGQSLNVNKFYWGKKESNIWVTLRDSSVNTYTIIPVTVAHSGLYRCAARSSSNLVRLNVSALPKATLTVDPKWHPLCNGETITLRCEVDSYSNWTYSWYKDQVQMVSQTTSHSVTGNKLTIPSAAESDQGQYWCEGRLVGRKVTSKHSDSITLTVAALPKATLTVETKWRPLYNGETVTLRCEVDSHSNWTYSSYSWYKHHDQTATSLSNEYNIPGAAESDQGQYWCEGMLEGRNVTSQHSDSITLTVAALPKANLIVEPKWRPLYNGETITLRCEVDFNSNWTYIWYRDHNQTATSLSKEYSVNITGAAWSQQGQYWCEGRLEERNVTSQRSNSITLTVAAMTEQSLPVILSISLGVSLIVLSALIFILFRKGRRNKEAGGCEDVVYSTVNLTNQKRMKRNTDEAEGCNDVVYSTLALEDQKKKNKEKNTAKAEAEGGNDVVYSTLALDDQKKEMKKKEKNI